MISDITIVITTYNRLGCVSNAIDSVLNNTIKSKIIVIDDCSTDNTLFFLKKKYKSVIKKNIITLKKTNKNIGVTGAKNLGFMLSKTSYVGFLDSDDILLPNSIKNMSVETANYPETLIFFFRCIDQNNNVVGEIINNSFEIDLGYYIRNSSKGEVFTVINKNKYDYIPYYSILRGYEGLGCAKILEQGKGLISSKVVREYRIEGVDRLSVGKGFYKRCNKLSRGHLLFLKKYYKHMSFQQKLLLKLKAWIYKIIYNASSLI